jgi:hypothetical protein
MYGVMHALVSSQQNNDTKAASRMFVNVELQVIVSLFKLPILVGRWWFNIIASA